MANRRQKKSIAATASGADCPTPTGMTQSPGQRGHAQAAAHPSGEQMDVAGIIGQGILDMMPEGLAEEIKAQALEIAGDVHEKGAAIFQRISEKIEGAMEGGGLETYDEMGERWASDTGRRERRAESQRIRENTRAVTARSGRMPETGARQREQVQASRATQSQQVLSGDAAEAQRIAQRRAERLQGMSDEALSRLSETMGSMDNAPKIVTDEIAAEMQRRGM